MRGLSAFYPPAFGGFSRRRAGFRRIWRPLGRCGDFRLRLNSARSFFEAVAAPRQFHLSKSRDDARAP
ncbi:MAG: hypothetical protein A3E78_09410 [Alphaproteobacteria bacterium RIFCSPHIGHO2_12_FULL_63_12]|nr:MAG: hypothetical protein A3E78_09410 [Alphaproteobacteria bacterium RIFCSPHIGHO2_12_FULL_63_12]